MELEKIERLKELIKNRESIINSLKTLEGIERGCAPYQILFEWKNGHQLAINIPFGTSRNIEDFFKDLLNKELEEVENWIKKL